MPSRGPDPRPSSGRLSLLAGVGLGGLGGVRVSERGPSLLECGFPECVVAGYSVLGCFDQVTQRLFQCGESLRLAHAHSLEGRYICA